MGPLQAGGLTDFSEGLRFFDRHDVVEAQRERYGRFGYRPRCTFMITDKEADG